VSFDGLAWSTGRESEKGWVDLPSSATKVTVSLG
jgi:hypothetical protein